MTDPFSAVHEFEMRVADFFGAPYAVATDCCTHAVELVLRYRNQQTICSPTHTYISIPMLAHKLGIELEWYDSDWTEMYEVNDSLTPMIFDAATLWKKDSYIPYSYMCLSFQFKKHLSLGRGGMILLQDKEDAYLLRRMAYDGRGPGIAWAEQDIHMMGYHYYMTPETAQLGLDKLPDAIKRKPKTWSWKDYPDLTKMRIFQ